MRFRNCMGKRILDCRGQGLTEYIILVLIIAVASIAITRSLGNVIRSKIEVARGHLDRDLSIHD